LNQAAVNAALASAENAIGAMETKIYSAYISDVVYILPNLSAMLSARVDHFTGILLHIPLKNQRQQQLSHQS
jgi:iron complex outermembrane receptor protein